MYNDRAQALRWFLMFLSADIEGLPDWRVAELKAAAEHHFRPRLPIASTGKIDWHGWNKGATSWLPDSISDSGDWRRILIDIRTDLRNFMEQEFINADPESASAINKGLELWAMFGVFGGKGSFSLHIKTPKPITLDSVKTCARMNLAMLLGVVDQESVKRCAHCRVFFLNTTKRRRLFCTPRCASRAAAKAHRDRIREANKGRQKRTKGGK